jgi:hypothetical protein
VGQKLFLTSLNSKGKRAKEKKTKQKKNTQKESEQVEFTKYFNATSITKHSTPYFYTP